MPAVTRIIRIKAQPHVPGGRFCRAGLCFGAAFTTVAEDELTPEQLAAFQAEPMLVVEIAEELKPTAPQAKAEAKAEERTKEGAKEEGKTADTPKETPPAAKAAPEAPTAPGAKAPAADAKAAEAKKEGGK